MKKEKLLTILVLLLALLNIGLLSYLVFGTKRGPMRHGPRMEDRAKSKSDRIDLLQTEFDFTDEQMVPILESVENHKKSSKSLAQQLETLTKTYYLDQDSSNDSLINEITALSKEMYLINKSHLEDLRQLAGNDKEEVFERLVGQLVRGRLGNNKGKKRPPHKKR